MNKFYMNGKLIHKASDHNTKRCEVEKWVFLPHSDFERLKANPYQEHEAITAARDLMYEDKNAYHCIMLLDEYGDDGLLIEAEGFDYPRLSMFVPDAKSIYERYQTSESELKLHDMIKDTVEKISELAHTGKTDFTSADMIDMDEVESLVKDANVIHDNAQPYEYYEESPAYVQDLNVIDKSIKVAGDVVISGTTFEGDCYIIADGNITYNVNAFNSTGRVFLYSRNGNITINGTSINLNGGIYAPNGNVSFNTYETNLTGFVWADSITYSGSIFNVNADNFDMLEPRCVVKTYTIDEDFNDGQFNGLGLSVPNELTLDAVSGEISPSEESVYGDTETGKGVKVTYSSDKSSVAGNGDTVTIKYGLSGFGEADVAENAVDLIIVVDESGSMSGSRMTNTKTAAKEIISQMKDNDRCAVVGFTYSANVKQDLTSDNELLNSAVDRLYANGGTAIYTGIDKALSIFNEQSDENRQKYIILLSDGEDGAEAHSLQSATTAGNSGVRIFSMKIGGGTLQMQNIAINSNGIYKNAPTSDDIVKIMSYFASEVFNVAGRNTTFKTTIKDADSVDISSITSAPSKVTANDDGSVTVEWNIDRITIDEQKEISIPVTVTSDTEGFADILENTSCVYYDRNGKPNIVYADDVSIPISNYAESGNWTVVFDSERETVDWENIYWNGNRYGDGTISVYVSASEDGENFSEPVKVENHQSFTGVSGRYVKISVDMSVSSDGRSPELYDITIVSKDAVLEQMTNSEPVVSINSKERTKVNVPMRMRAVLTDDCLKSDISITWSCEDENVKFSDTSKLLTSVICAETGSYDITCTVSDGENTVRCVKTIMCEPADNYADIDPDHQDEAVAPQISVALPQYADRKEQISAKIENLNDTEISWYSVIFNNNTAVDVTDDGEFTLTMPNSDGTYKVVVRAFDWSGKSDVKEYSIIVDSTSAAVNIIPSPNEAIIGSEAYFKVSVAGSHKIKELTHTLNGELITIPEDGTLVLDTTSEKEYILEAHGLTLTNKEIAASAKLTVIEADTEKPVVKISFDKNSYNEKQNAVVTVTATDNVGVTSLVVLLNGDEIQLDSNGKYTISNLKYGDYIVTANAADASGNVGTATDKITANDVTNPELTLTVDKTEIKVGESVNITVNASDNNGVVSTELTVGTEKLTISDDNTAIFTPDAAGSYVIKATAVDPSGNKTEKKATINVVEPDTVAPVVNITLDKDTYFEKDDVIITVEASDNVGVVNTILLVDGNEVALSENGTYTISKAALKDYEIIAKAYDAENNEGSMSVIVTVNEARAPEIRVIFDKDIYIEGDSLVGFVKAEGSRDIASLTAKVNNQLLAVEDGRFELAELKEGIYKFEFCAEDISGLSSKTEKSVTVLSKDNADIRLVALIDKQVKLGENAELKIIASDEIDKSTISATLNGESITLDGDLKYQFKGENLFDNTFEIKAKTLSGESLSITLTVLVYETNKPKIGLVFTSHDDGYHYAHDNIIGTLTVTDESGIREVHVYYDGVELPIDEDDHVYINDFVVANHTVIVRAVDNFGNVAVSGMAFYTVTSSSGTASDSDNEELDSSELNAYIYSPQEGGCVKGLDYIIGRADGTKFSSYKLEYASIDDKKFILLNEGTDPKNNQILGEFDTTMLRNGLYYIRLTVFDAERNYKTSGMYVTVEGNANIGNFSIGFEDLTTNSLQTPITLTRIYDSRDRNVSGDFGYGWSQAVKNIRIYTNGPLGYGWEMEYDWRKGVIFNPTKSHIITVDWGNGKTDKFTMTAKSRNDAGLGYTAGVYFTPMSGTTASLSAEGAPGYYQCSKGYLFDDEEYTIFDPQNWTLTTADGTKYAINSIQGLQSITDKSGQTMNFASGKIEGANESLTITRDAANRITSVKTPSGSEVSYMYDENGDIVSVTDISGNVMTFKYKDHYLEEIIDPRGVRVSKNIYDDDGRLIKTIDADGNEIVYDHDVYGREEIITDRNGGVSRYIYDQNGNVLSQTDPMGNTVINTYDSNGDLTSKTDAMGNVTNCTYNNGNIASLTDAEGNVITNTYDTSGRVLSINAMGTDVLSFTYDDTTGEITSMTDALGNTTLYDYEGKNLKSVSDSIGTYLNMTYNSDGEVISTSNGNPVSTVSNPDGSLNTQRRFNFDYENGTVFPYGFTEDLYHFRPSWRDYDTPDYSRYRKPFAANDGTDVATGNYSKSFTDFSITSPGVHADFMRTYNSMNEEEGSFGKGWDFNVDVSKILFPAYGYYQVVLPDGSNTTFKDDGNGGFECMNAHSRMERNGNEYTITNASNAKYHFNSEGRLDEVQDASGNTLLISGIDNNYRYVTDSTGRRYSIHYIEINGKRRIDSIIDNCNAAENEQRSVSYQYDDNGRLVSFTGVTGGVETYEYDDNGYLRRIVDCYGDAVEEAGFLNHGELSYIINSSGLKQQYKYDKAEKTTSMDEYDGNSLLKSYFYSYDESCALKTTEVTAAGQLFTLNKIKYTQTEGKNRYNEIQEVTDIKDNTTSYERDGNGNVTKVIYADGSYSLTRYNDKNMPVIQSDECGYITITRYDETGIKAVREYNKFFPVSDPQAFVNNYNENMALSENDYSVTEYTYASASETGGVKGLVKTITSADNVTVEYCYGVSGYAKGLPVIKYVKIDNTIIAKTEYEYNEQLQPSVERVYADISHNIASVKEFEYDAFSNLIEVRDYGTGTIPKVSITEYDLLSRKTADYSPLYAADRSHSTTYTYYPNGKIKTVTDVMGHAVTYSYNKYGQLTSTKYPDGTMDVTVYDELDRVSATGFKYDESSPLQYMTSVDYAFEDHTYTIITPDGSREASYKGLRTNTHTYISGSKHVNSSVLADIRGNIVEEKINDNVKLTSVYYENGQLAKRTDANGNDTLYEYGKFGLLTKTTVPLSNNTSSMAVNSYDDCGRLVMSKKLSQAENETTPKWIISENVYDAFGNLSQTTLKNSDSDEKSIARYFYNDMGIQTSMQTGLSSENDQDYLTTYFHYDNWFRSVRKTDSTGYDSGTVEYDLDNNVISSSDTIGNRSVYTYDLLGRILTVDTTNASDPSKNVSSSYEYDIMGRVKTAATNGITTIYEYDKLGRKYSEREASANHSVFRGYFYEGVSPFLSREITGRYNLLMYSSKEYVYDDEMRLQTVKEDGTEIVSYSYDAVGNKLTETLGNGVVSNYSYNRLNKITNIETALDGDEISNYQYFYNLNGSDYCKIRTEGGIIEETSYGYDGLNRLVSESVAVNDNVTDTYSYEYDDYGNRSRMTASGTENYSTVYDYNDAQGNYTSMLQKETKTIAPSTISSIPSVKETAYSYDANGNLISETSGSTTKTYTYNSINQLVGYTDGSTTAAYTYNTNGLRIEKVVNGQRINHVWDGSGQIVADINGNDIYNAKCYVRGTGLAAKYDFVSGSKTGYTYYLQNAHGDVDDLLNENGIVTKSYRYDAFGVEKNIDDNDMNAFRYCGEYYDKETATVYLRARYYNSSTGRFISRDSYAGKNEDPLSLNRYTYCHNNPLIFVDLDGHKTYDLGKDWEARIESSHGNNNDKGQHVHLSYKDGKKTYSQNDDGSPHDKNNNSSGSPPAKVLKKLKEKTGWDWNKNEENFLNKAEYDYCGTISKPYYQLYAVYQVTYADETIRFAYESPFNEFSPSTDRLKDIYEDGMTSNPIKGEQNTGTSSVIIGPMPYSGPITFPSFGFFPFPAFGF